MRSSGLERLAPLAGVVSVALMIGGSLIIGFFTYLPSAEQVGEFLNAHATQVSLGGYLGSLSAFFLIWFAASLRGDLRRHEGGDGRLSELAFAGGVASGAVMAVGFSLMSIAGQRAGSAAGITPQGAVILYDSASSIEGAAFAVTIAVTIGATGLLSIRKGAFPAWFGWLSAILALLLLSPIAYLALAVAVLWLVLVSIWLYGRRQSA